MLTLFLGGHAALSDTPQKTLQMNEAQNRPGAAAQIRTVEGGGEKASDGAFFESLLLQFVISSARPDRHVGTLIGILERLGNILRLISGNHLLIDRIVLIGFARNDHVDELTKVRIRLRIQIFRED